MTGPTPPPEIPPLRPRPPTAHKGDMGRVLIVGGSPGLTGAVAMAAEAALRSGAGLVTCAVAASLHAIMEVKTTEAMSTPLDDDGQGYLVPEAMGPLQPLLEAADAVVVGPGLGRAAATQEFVTALIGFLDRPHLLDADGLWHLSRLPEQLREGHPERVLTPHPGEMGRLLEALDSGLDPGQAGPWFADRIPGVLVLKGHETEVRQGSREYRNRTGNAGMATAGSGDVLSGVIGAFLGRGDPPWDAAVRGVYLHGLAGDIACGEVGPESLVATDITMALPGAFRALASAP